MERQRQVDYANRRRQPHIGAKLPSSAGAGTEDKN
jgi:hypothetical protein